MAKTLLRSGNLDDFQAVGGGGQAVFDSALQIREALRLRKQQALVDCLAIPQVNDDGDRVDWYSPIDGQSVAWKAAEEEARFRALRYLESTLDSARALSRKCLQSPKTAQQLFGSLLEKALQFPGENHVFLVEGKPVITFWGFVNLNESAREDVLECLQEQEVEEPVIEMLPQPEPEDEPSVAVNFTHADEPLFTPVVEVKPQPEVVPPVQEPLPVITPVPATEPEPVFQPTPKKQRRYALWALPIAVAVAAAVATPLLLNEWQHTPDDVVKVETTVEKTTAIAPQPLPAVPALAANLPLSQAQVSEPKVPEVVKPVVIKPIPKEALVMDALQVKMGSTRFLNGDWSVSMAVKDPVTGKAPNVRFQIQNNKGTAKITQGKNVTCRANLYSGLHQTGELMIKSRSNARCSDGTQYPLPDITCKASSNDVAECSARVDANTTVPVTFKKTGG
ncbi:SrfA family protein [Salmonella enterica]